MKNCRASTSISHQEAESALVRSEQLHVPCPEPRRPMPRAPAELQAVALRVVLVAPVDAAGEAAEEARVYCAAYMMSGAAAGR